MMLIAITNILTVQLFVAQFSPYAIDIERRYNLPAHAIIAQSALETGWGEHIPEGSFNVFGIRAGSGWKGKTVRRITQEYIQGEWVTVYASFRAYDSYAECYKDYANSIRTKECYAEAVLCANAFDYITAVHEGGYATDKKYARKIKRIMRKYIGVTNATITD